MTAKIVLLNGVGSAGKSSIARALQTIATEPFLHVQMDAFIDMLPPALQDHADGFSFETVLEDGKPSVVIRSGPVSARAMRGMRHAIAAMAGQGNNLIVDDVIFNEEMRSMSSCCRALTCIWSASWRRWRCWKRARPRAPTGCPAWRAGNMDASTTA